MNTFIHSRRSRFLSWLKHFGITFVITDVLILGAVFISEYFLLHQTPTLPLILRGLYGSLYVVVPISLSISMILPIKPIFFKKEIDKGLFPTFNILGGDELIVDLDEFKTRNLMKAVTWCDPTPIEVEALVTGIGKAYVRFTDAEKVWEFAVSKDEFINNMIYRMKGGIYKGSIILDKVGDNNIVYMKVVKK